MPRQIAFLVFVVFVMGLIALSRERNTRTSKALWIPIIWFFIGASRNISEWFGRGTGAVGSPDQYLDGSPIDRMILIVFLVAGMAVLFSRGQRFQAVFQENKLLIFFFTYCLFSILWSDFPFVAFKRWSKGFGNLLMVFIVLTELDPVAAVKRFLSWTGFVLIPFSVLLIKYYPEFGRGYDRFSGEVRYLGAVGDKNGLGYDCLVMGLGALWCFLGALGEKEDRFRRLLAYGTLLTITFWLFHLAHSATSLTCFLLGAGVMLVLKFFCKGQPARVHLFVGTSVFVGLFAFVFLDAYSYLVNALGRETNLTGRTDIWADLLHMNFNPVVGTGFETFFLGNRLDFLWSKYWWHPQEAHNGYLETYLTLGWIGLGLLVLLILFGYRNILARYRQDPHSSMIRLAFLGAALFYNITESAFKVMHPVWIVFLLSIAVVPKASAQQEELPLASDEDGVAEIREAEVRIA
jgi:exopolysaccharide production protein ExoQ